MNKGRRFFGSIIYVYGLQIAKLTTSFSFSFSFSALANALLWGIEERVESKIGRGGNLKKFSTRKD